MPDRRTLAVGLVVAGILGLAAGRAEALDLTREWEGHMICRGLHDGKPERFRCCSTLLISQTGDELHVYERDNDLQYFGRVQARASNPDKGTAVLVGCATDNTLPPDSEMAFLEAVAKPGVVKPGKVTGTLKGSGPFRDAIGGEEHLLCKWSFRRVSTDDPGVSTCP